MKSKRTSNRDKPNKRKTATPINKTKQLKVNVEMDNALQDYRLAKYAQRSTTSKTPTAALKKSHIEQSIKRKQASMQANAALNLLNMNITIKDE